MITDLQEKLNEAQYFLRRMKEVANDREHFRWNLSAFLSAARSVTMIMNVQYARSDGYEGWLDGKIKEADLRTGGMVKYLKEQRRLTVHVRPLRPSAFIQVDLTMHLDIGINAPTVITGTSSTLATKSISQPLKVESTVESTRKQTYYFDDIKDRDILSICGSYIEEIKAIAAECERKFEGTRKS